MTQVRIFGLAHGEQVWSPVSQRYGVVMLTGYVSTTEPLGHVLWEDGQRSALVAPLAAYLARVSRPTRGRHAR
jgi:hypothetical protein